MIFDEFSSFFYRYTEMGSVQLLESLVRRFFIDFGKLFFKVVVFLLESPFLAFNPFGNPTCDLQRN